MSLSLLDHQLDCLLLLPAVVELRGRECVDVCGCVCVCECVCVCVRERERENKIFNQRLTVKGPISFRYPHIIVDSERDVVDVIPVDQDSAVGVIKSGRRTDSLSWSQLNHYWPLFMVS